MIIGRNFQKVKLNFETLKLLSHGNITKEIAEKLGRSHRTIENNIDKMIAANDCKNRTELVAKALREKFIV